MWETVNPPPCAATGTNADAAVLLREVKGEERGSLVPGCVIQRGRERETKGGEERNRQQRRRISRCCGQHRVAGVVGGVERFRQNDFGRGGKNEGVVFFATPIKTIKVSICHSRRPLLNRLRSAQQSRV